MGIYDRDYYPREPQQGMTFRPPRTVVGTIILINVVLWVADYLIHAANPERGYWLTDMMAVSPGVLAQPWLWWKFLTAGFAHSPNNFSHILGNMLVLFFLGRDVEQAYGSKEFLRVYLAMLVFASVVWCAVNFGNPYTSAIGASGAITGVVILYALTFPHTTLLLFFVLPVPAWLVGVLYVVLDMFGALGGRPDENIAFSMHLAGAAFALAYHQRGWNLTRAGEVCFGWLTFRRKPRLRVHAPDEPEPSPESENLTAEVDRILAKIYRDGEASLSTKERKTLETASREYQRNRTTDRRG